MLTTCSSRRAARSRERHWIMQRSGAFQQSPRHAEQAFSVLMSAARSHCELLDVMVGLFAIMMKWMRRWINAPLHDYWSLLLEALLVVSLAIVLASSGATVRTISPFCACCSCSLLQAAPAEAEHTHTAGPQRSP